MPRFGRGLKQGLDNPGIPVVLDFLQAGVELGLSISTLKALVRSTPVRVRACPTWDLSLVLRALTGSPLEPLETSLLKWVGLFFLLYISRCPEG